MYQDYLWLLAAIAGTVALIGFVVVIIVSTFDFIYSTYVESKLAEEYERKRKDIELENYRRSIKSAEKARKK